MTPNNRLSILRDGWFPVTDLSGDFDQILNSIFMPVHNKVESSFSPSCEAEEKEDHFLVVAEMPGVSRDDIKLELFDGRLTISGERKNATSERRVGKFQRSFSLPTNSDTSKIEAHYENGVLRVVVPKAESAKPRQIKILGAPTQTGTSRVEAEASEESRTRVQAAS